VAKELSRDEYVATFAEPMRLLGNDESHKPIPLKAYVEECIRDMQHTVSLAQLEIHAVYLNGAKTFYHVLINFGQKNRFLVIVVDCEREVVHGHYLLNLNDEYGLKEQEAK
jgi:hypothetical protein